MRIYDTIKKVISKVSDARLRRDGLGSSCTWSTSTTPRSWRTCSSCCRSSWRVPDVEGRARTRRAVHSKRTCWETCAWRWWNGKRTLLFNSPNVTRCAMNVFRLSDTRVRKSARGWRCCASSRYWKRAWSTGRAESGWRTTTKNSFHFTNKSATYIPKRFPKTQRWRPHRSALGK